MSLRELQLFISEGKSIIPDGSTLIQENDQVFFIAATKDIRVVMSEMRKLESPRAHGCYRRCGNIGFRLAKALEQTNQVKVIERDRKTVPEGRSRSRLDESHCLSMAMRRTRSLLLEENTRRRGYFRRH